MRLTTLKQIDLICGHLLAFALRPLARLLGRLLHRDHRLTVERHLVVLKMLGGGSLIIAFPALLALRRRFPDRRMTLVCSPGVKSYADLLHLFDEIVLIETRSVGRVLGSGLRALRKAWRADCIVDLEVHSKLSTVFCLLTGARNRVGYHMGQNRWRLGLGTHFLFLNQSSLIATSYNQLAAAFGAEIDIEAAVSWFRSNNDIAWDRPALVGERILSLAPYCSELGQVREFTAAEWAQILHSKLGDEPACVVVLGDSSRVDDAAELERVLAESLAGCQILVLVGRTSLEDVVGILRSVGELLTIDSGVLHIARLLGLEITSFWGPTDPGTRLLPMPDVKERVVYRKIFCSPCVHHIDTAPCLGNNICMKQHLGPVDVARYEARGWYIDRDSSPL